jgi:hypothetical protein
VLEILSVAENWGSTRIRGRAYDWSAGPDSLFNSRS